MLRRYSKIVLTTSSMLRCTSTSSVSAQTTPTWQARRAGMPCVDQLAGVDEQARADALAEAVLAQVAHLLAELREVLRDLLGDAALVRDDLRLQLLARVGELDRDEALARAVLQVLERALVARVVRDDEQEALARLERSGRASRSAACGGGR